MTLTINNQDQVLTINQNGGLVNAGSANALVYNVSALGDLPTPVNGVIDIPAGVSLFVTNHVDLDGNRLNFVGDACIFGTSSETASLTSTGLDANTALITSAYDLPMRNLLIKDVGTAFALAANDNTKALDWYAVNFENCTTLGTVSGYSNFIQSFSAFFSCGKIRFGGTIGTVGFDSCLFSLPVGKAVEFASDFVATRRIRFVFCPFVITAGNTGIDLPLTATVPVDSYIISDCNFGGGGTYLAGVTSTSDIARFRNNRGIANTAVNGQLYMQGNATATTILNTNDYYKVAGTTIPSSDNAKYTHSNNRLTNNSVITRKFLVQASFSFTSGNANVCEFGFYDSTLAAVRTPSRTKATANSAGRAENVSLFCVIEHEQGDYIELHCRNTSATNSITVTDLNMLITEF